MKLLLLSLFTIFNSFLFSECFNLSSSNCNGNCEWVEDVETGYCGNHNSAGSCPNYPACSWSCQGGWYLGECVGWYACTGGYYEIDNSYCEETQMSSCSEFNEIGCEESAECQWTENIELESCNDINIQQQCNDLGCSWYNGNYYACSICCWGEYEVDNSYCEEMQYQLGDINQDNTINVQDVILTVNLVLNVEYIDSADMNSDNILNVLDIIQIVNLILD